ncbi:MAG: putative metal-binding motif-containing protein [Deltaproteobacteria bacterium]|nr:putative metal-binding motif-containing protein [Deltaproteobacteria bacterium]
MRRAWCSLLCFGASLLVGGGCGGETGLLVAVSGGPVDELEFRLAVKQGDKFLLQPVGAGERHDVRGRDLAARPYELLLRDDAPDGGALEVRVLVLGHRAEAGKLKITRFAVTDPPQAFVRGEVLRRAVILQGFSGANFATAFANGCYRVRVVNKAADLVLPYDQDCDGSNTTDPKPDCNDQDATVHPGAPELCDGKDNNCDRQFAPASMTCYLEAPEGQCRKGSRQCRDAQGSGWDKQCAASERVPHTHCHAAAECGANADPAPCTSQVKRRTVHCTLERQDGGGVCSGGTLALQPPEAGLTSCSWEVYEAGPFAVGLRGAGSTGFGLTTSSCKALLSVEPGPGEPAGGTAVLEFLGPSVASSYVGDLQVTLKVVPSCGTNPLSCSL